MENLCQRFPHVIMLVLDNVDDKSLVNCRKASKEMSEFLPIERFYWIRIIKHYSVYFGSFENCWRKVINKTPVEIIKQLAVEVQEVFFEVSKSSWPPLICNILICTRINNIGEIAPLHIAAAQGNLKLCEHILEKTEEKNPKGDIEIVTGVFNPGNVNHGYKVIYALTPLGIAVLKGDFEVCNLIMDQISVREFELELDLETPLHLAGMSENFKVFKVIMKLFRDPNHSDVFGQKPLHLAAKYLHSDICELIISKVDNIQPIDEDEDMPLDYAVSANNLEIVDFFQSFNIQIGNEYIWIRDSSHLYRIL